MSHESCRAQQPFIAGRGCFIRFLHHMLSCLGQYSKHISSLFSFHVTVQQAEGGGGSGAAESHKTQDMADTASGYGILDPNDPYIICPFSFPSFRYFWPCSPPSFVG